MDFDCCGECSCISGGLCQSLLLLKHAPIDREDEEPDQDYHRNSEQDEYRAAPVGGRSLHYCTRKVAVRLIEIDVGMPGYFIRKLSVLLVLTRTKTSGPP